MRKIRFKIEVISNSDINETFLSGEKDGILDGEIGYVYSTPNKLTVPFTFILEDESAEEHRYISTQTNRVIKIKVVDNGIKISGDTESLGKVIYWILTRKDSLPSNLKSGLLI